MPRNLAIGLPIDGLSDDELDAAIAIVCAMLPSALPSAA
jgi:hypothetical protein